MESMILATKSGTPIIGQIAASDGLDHEWLSTRVLDASWYSEPGSLYHYFQYPDLPLYDSAAGQTAEIL